MFFKKVAKVLKNPKTKTLYRPSFLKDVYTCRSEQEIGWHLAKRNDSIEYQY